MPPKPKRLPPPALQHLKHSRQLLENFLYQYLPQLTGMGSISRINLYTWFSGQWGLTPDGSQGIPYMVLEALRLQRQHLLMHKLAVKPLTLSLLSPKEDKLLQKALPQLQELNSQSRTATINSLGLSWQDLLKLLQQQLQRQPAAERNLLLLNPIDLPLPSLIELLQLLPKKMDLLLVLPATAIRQAGGILQKHPLPEVILALAKWLSPLLQIETAEIAEPEIPASTASLLQQLKATLAGSSKRFVMHYPVTEESTPIVLVGLTHDALMMEKMLLARRRLEELQARQLQTGNQLGLFGSNAAAKTETVAAADHLVQLLARQGEWSNQELYGALLQQELLPQEAAKLIQELIGTGKLEVLDEKKKKKAATDALGISHTAYKLPAPSRYFRLKQ